MRSLFLWTWCNHLNYLQHLLIPIHTRARSVMFGYLFIRLLAVCSFEYFCVFDNGMRARANENGLCIFRVTCHAFGLRRKVFDLWAKLSIHLFQFPLLFFGYVKHIGFDADALVSSLTRKRSHTASLFFQLLAVFFLSYNYSSPPLYAHQNIFQMSHFRRSKHISSE